MYHLLIERVSTVTIEFLQYRARVRIGLNRAGIERAVERTGLFTSLVKAMVTFSSSVTRFEADLAGRSRIGIVIEGATTTAGERRDSVLS
jgi:hypothetical protein